MSRLEDSYRSLLRVLPQGYRERWEDDMVATFLAGAVPDGPEEAELVELGRPRLTETLSVLALAARLHLGGEEAGRPAAGRGEAVRLVALIGLLAHAVMALVGLVVAFAVAGRLPGLDAPAAAAPPPAEMWRAAWQLSAVLSVPAYLALVTGHRQWARGLAVIGLVPALITAVALGSDTGGAFALSAVCGLLFAALPVLALAAWHDSAPVLDARPWLWALPAGVIGVGALLVPLAMAANPLVDWPGLWTGGLLVAAAVHLSRFPAAGSWITASWTTALIVLTSATLGLRAGTLLDLARNAGPGDRLVTVAIAETVLLLAVVAALTARSRSSRGTAGPLQAAASERPASAPPAARG